MRTININTKENPNNTYFIVTDVHGEYDIMRDALIEAGFDYDNRNHILISLGDNFDRGRKSLEVYKDILWLNNRGRFFGIRGNHEDIFINHLISGDSSFDFQNNGFNETIISFTNGYQLDPNELTMHYPMLLSFLSGLVDVISIDDVDLYHAGKTSHFIRYGITDLPGDKEVVDNWADVAKYIKAYKGDRIQVMGHRYYKSVAAKFDLKVEDGRSFFYNNCYAIDSSVNTTGRLFVGTICHGKSLTFIEHNKHKKEVK